jgi:hypothetical protein
MDGEDVGMRQHSHGAGFALEACLAVGVVGEWFGQDFDGDLAAQAYIAGAIHLSHAARTEGSDNLVRPKSCQCGEHGGRHLRPPHRDGDNCLLVELFLQACQVPNLHRLILAPGNQAGAIGGERRAADKTFVVESVITAIVSSRPAANN